ncbi:hypothetical protein [uncultured Bartonella sp.]|uniref:hypothetical protein n=1 Tax=uncultured Bartonella sp. TaxID=104108 RepID=UPI0025F37B0C|nr:hypothetical protein [uncultured Bartonella sp.]
MYDYVKIIGKPFLSRSYMRERFSESYQIAFYARPTRLVQGVDRKHQKLVMVFFVLAFARDNIDTPVAPETT